MFQGALLIGQRWGSLSQTERARLSALVRDSRGRLGNLSAKERRELRELLAKLHLRGLPGELAALLPGVGGRRRRRRRARA
jgi:hypothetical protein